MQLTEYPRLPKLLSETPAMLLHSNRFKIFVGIVFILFLCLYISIYNGSKYLKTLDYNHLVEPPPLKLKFVNPYESSRNVEGLDKILHNQTSSEALRTTGELNDTLAPGSERLFTSDHNQSCSKTLKADRKLNVAPVPEKKCSAPFLSIFDGGRLGNQICQYMSLLYFRKRFGVRVITSFKMRKSLLQVFENIPTPFSPSNCFKTKDRKFQSQFGTMVKVFENATSNNISFREPVSQRSTQLRHFNFISHYPCPLDYLLMYREELKSELHIKKALLLEARKVIQEHLANANQSIENVTLISVHARRTDYLNYTKTHNVKLPPSSFYKKAMNFYRSRIPNAIFMVLSDDLKWVTENISGSDIFYPGTSNIENPLLDYAILSSCHHHIYGLGTFGATSAFLGSGTIAYYGNEKAAKLFAEAAPSLKCWSSQVLIPMTD